MIKFGSEPTSRVLGPSAEFGPSRCNFEFSTFFFVTSSSKNFEKKSILSEVSPVLQEGRFFDADFEYLSQKIV